MKKNCLFNEVNSEKGAATVLVLCVILVLIALGTLALVTSALNTSLSGKVMNWTKEYYDLDTKAEKYVQKIDQELITAENDARIYVRDRYDKKPAGEPSEFTDDTLYHMDNGAQAFFNGHYQETWTRKTTDGAIEITLQDYIDDPEFMLAKSASYKKDKSLTAEQAFSADVKKYNDELFDRTYFFMLSKRLAALADSVTPGAITLKEREASLGDSCTDKFTEFSTVTWESMTPNDGDIKLIIKVSNNSAADPKEVRARISVVKPYYKTILQTISTPVYGNPIWTNAITASGSINFASGASATIDGDVYVSGTDGISVGDGSNDVIRGNVYTQGDLAITGNKGRLSVSGPSQVSYEDKRKIYGNDYFFDSSGLTAGSKSLDEYLNTDDSKKMPFFFNDFRDRKNVYCNSLLVKDGVTGGKLQIDGNIWTKDDIQMDGRQSSISIGTSYTSGSAIVPLTSYIGLNPYSTKTDPNLSSSVINNYPAKDDGTVDSSIRINSSFVVPGVAFYEFDGGKYYYKSAESVSARTTSPTAIFYAYFYDGSAMPYNTFTSSEGVNFDLITPSDEMNVKKNALYSFFGANGNIKTNITTDLTAPVGYTAGVALLQRDDSSYAKLFTSGTTSGTGISTLPGSGQYLVNYTKLQNALMAAFDSKTKQLGKADGGNFSDLVDSLVPTELSEIIKDIDPATGARILDLGDSSTILEGIVYSDRDLTIRGKGVFKGTVICKGNVTVTGSPTIIYDEGVIWGKLEMYKSVRDFFAKGNTGGVIGTINDYSSTSGERTVLKRYKILSWQEKSPAPGA